MRSPRLEVSIAVACDRLFRVVSTHSIALSARGPHHRFENQSMNSVEISGDSSSAASATVGKPFEAAMADRAHGKKSLSQSRSAAAATNAGSWCSARR